MDVPPRHETKSPGTLWLRLHEHPFEGEWVGLSADWAETLPCDPIDLAWTRLWICLRSPAESALSSRLLETIRARMLAAAAEDLHGA